MRFIVKLSLSLFLSLRKQVKTLKLLLIQHDFQFLGNFISMENQQNIFLNFFFILVSPYQCLLLK